MTAAAAAYAGTINIDGRRDAAKAIVELMNDIQPSS